MLAVRRTACTRWWCDCGTVTAAPLLASQLPIAGTRWDCWRLTMGAFGSTTSRCHEATCWIGVIPYVLWQLACQVLTCVCGRGGLTVVGGQSCQWRRFGGVDDDGDYSSIIPHPDLRFAASLGQLLYGRLTMSGGANNIAKVSKEVCMHVPSAP